MKILHVYNRHRGGGGSDNAWDETISLLRTHGIEVAVFEKDSKTMSKGITGKIKAFTSGIYARGAVKAFTAMLQDYKPDIVHTHELYPYVSPWILPVCTRAKIPVVHTCYDFRLTCPVATHFHNGSLCRACASNTEFSIVNRNCRNNYLESTAYGLRNAVTRSFALFSKHVSEFIVLTEFSKQWLCDDVGIANERITVNPCAIPLQPEACNPATGQYIAFAGRFVPEKGVELLIQLSRQTGLPLKLAGGATTHPGICHGDPVECILTPNRQALDDFYRQARMLIVPSLWYETFGIVAAEAMSHGVPVVASRIGALQYTVKHDVSGLLFETGNLEDLKTKVNRLWNDPGLCNRLGQGGRKEVKQRFDVKLHLQNLLSAYEKARHNPIFAH